MSRLSQKDAYHEAMQIKADQLFPIKQVFQVWNLDMYFRLYHALSTSLCSGTHPTSFAQERLSWLI